MTLRLDLLSALAPRLRLARTGGWRERRRIGSPPRKVTDLVQAECELDAGEDAAFIVEALLQRADAGVVLRRLCLDLTALLERATELLELADRAGPLVDPSVWECPEFKPRAQEIDAEGWVILIDLVRWSFEIAYEAGDSVAGEMVNRFIARPMPVFRRLIWHGFEVSGLPSASRMLRLVRMAPEEWLWSPVCSRERDAAMLRFWSALHGEEREGLIEIVCGSDVARAPAASDRGEWEAEALAYSVWRLLSRMRTLDGSLPDRARDALARIEEEHPDWRAGADYPTAPRASHQKEPETETRELETLADVAIVAELIADVAGTGAREAWPAFVAAVPVRALAIMQALAARNEFDVGIWGDGLEALALQKEVSVSTQDGVLELFEAMPDELHRQIAWQASACLEMVSRSASSERGAWSEWLRAWDHSLELALDLPVRSDKNVVQSALNHPLGRVAQALLLRLGPSPRQHSGIPDWIKARIADIMQSESPAAELPKCIICSRLWVLHCLDPNWTREAVTPTFNWERVPESAAAWQGFLWAPRVDAELWVDLKPGFLKCFDHLDQVAVAGWGRSLGHLLAAAAITLPGSISAAESRLALRQLDTDRLADVAHWLVERLRGAGAEAAVLWRERIGPWLEAGWPRDLQHRDPRVARHLARVAIFSGTEFPRASALVAELAGGVDLLFGLVRDLRGEGHIDAHPRLCVALIDALVPTDRDPRFPDLGQFLSEARAADPALVDLPAYRRLEQLARRMGQA